jgi:hypothetical protein
VLGPVLFIRSVAAVSVGVWWGGLEQLRTDVREQARGGLWYTVRQRIDAWLFLTIIVVAATFAGTVGWVLLRPGSYERFSIFDAYIVACLLRLGVDLLARTYHSGLFALRRIHRPLWSLVLPDVLEVALIVALWPHLYLWCFGPAIVMAGALRAALVFHYTRRSYRSSRIPPISRRGFVRSISTVGPGDLLGFVRHGLANAVFQIDTVLILTLLYASVRNPAYMPLAVLFYVLRPFVTAGFSWSRLFYFDFKRLALGHSRFFRSRFERFLGRVAVVFSAVTAVLAIVWTAVFWRGPGIGWDLAALAPFFVARSLFGLYQMQAFSYGRYRYLFVTGAVVGLGILGVGLVPGDRLIVFSALAVLMILIVVLGGAPRIGAAGEEEKELPIVPLPRWLALLSGSGGEVLVGAARVNTASGGAARVMRELAEKIGAGAIARYGRNLLLWFERGPAGEGMTPARLVVATAGCLNSAELARSTDGGERALAELASGRILGERLNPLMSGGVEQRSTGAALRAEFESRFPGGEVLEVRKGRIVARGGRMAPYEVRRVMIDVLRAAGGRTIKPRASDKVDVTVYCPAGEPELLFVLERAVDARDRARWRRRVEDATLAGSLS